MQVRLRDLPIKTRWAIWLWGAALLACGFMWGWAAALHGCR